MTKIAVVMGSISDWPVMQLAVQQLADLGADCERRIISAHRMPATLQSYGEQAQARGIQVIIAGAGGAAHLPGMLAANTVVPVIGVPMQSRALNGMDSLLSIVQMPTGVPVATMAIGQAGAKNAALLAAQIVGLQDSKLQQALQDFRLAQRQEAQRSEQEL